MFSYFIFRLLLVIHHFTERVAPGCLLLSFFFLGYARSMPLVFLLSAWFIAYFFIWKAGMMGSPNICDPVNHGLRSKRVGHFLFTLLYFSFSFLFTSHSPFLTSLLTLGLLWLGYPPHTWYDFYFLLIIYYLPTYFILLLLLIVLKDLLLFLSFLLLVNFPIADQEVVNEFDI